MDLGDLDVNYATMKNVDEIATHILVFLIKGLANKLSFSFATFATNVLTSYQLYPIFWKAISILEMTCNLKVIAAVADGAATNRAMFAMHKVIFFVIF